MKNDDAEEISVSEIYFKMKKGSLRCLFGTLARKNISVSYEAVESPAIWLKLQLV